MNKTVRVNNASINLKRLITLKAINRKKSDYASFLNLSKPVKYFVLGLLITILYQADLPGQTIVPGGKVYSITIRNTQCNFDQRYTAFIPDGVPVIRGALIHQHGCTMEGTGEPTAYDLQYQAFAKKWSLALIGPDLYTGCNNETCGWIFPAIYSGKVLISALDSIGKLSYHNELKSAPWLLWGHSGGGYWVLAMAKEYPERTMAVFAYSPAFDPLWNFPRETAKIPVMIRHAGPTDLNTRGACWKTAVHAFEELRKMDGFASIAFTPGQTHNLSYVRYMAIPFYEAVLAQRLPDIGSVKLKDMDNNKAWLGDTTTHQIFKLSDYKGDRRSMSWLPDSATAGKWSEFVTTGTVADKTPPPAPYDAEIREIDNNTIELDWKLIADIESGIRYFNIYKNDQLIKRYPAAGNYQSFNTNGDNCFPLVPQSLTYNLAGINPGTDSFAITAVNHFGLESQMCHFGKIYMRANNKTSLSLVEY